MSCADKALMGCGLCVLRSFWSRVLGNVCTVLDYWFKGINHEKTSCCMIAMLGEEQSHDPFFVFLFKRASFIVSSHPTVSLYIRILYVRGSVCVQYIPSTGIWDANWKIAISNDEVKKMTRHLETKSLIEKTTQTESSRAFR